MDLFQDSFDDGNRSTFKTSPEVIQKVTNGARENTGREKNA